MAHLYERPVIIELNDIRKTYTTGGAKTAALRGINLEIRQGEFVAIMGPSGSGKSSLMHIIGLLDQKYEGGYLLNSNNVGKLSSNAAAKIRNDQIGFVFQQFDLLNRATVMQNVLLPTIYKSSPDDAVRAIEVLKQVGLLEHTAKRGNQLSGGQIQRVAIARALIMNPSYLLADEPTGNLDSKMTHDIMRLFQKINKTGTTIVLITHEEDVAKYAQRIIRLKDGLISEDMQ